MSNKMKYGALDSSDKLKKKGKKKSFLIISVTIFLALAGMLGFFYVYFNKIYDVMLEKDMEQIEWTSHFVTKLIHEDIEHNISGLQAGEELFHDYETLGREKVVTYLREMRENLDFEAVGIAGLDGKSIDDTGKIEWLEEPRFLKEITIREKYISDEIDISDNMLLAVPVHQKGRVVGAVWGHYAISTIAEKIELTDEMHRYFQIIDDSGEYISNSGNVHSFASNMNLWDEIKKYEFSDGMTGENLRENVEKGEKGYFHFTYQGEGRYVTYEPLGINNWYVFSVLVEDFLGDYVKEIEQIFTKLLTGLIFCMVFVMGIIGTILFQTMNTIKKQNQKLLVKDSLVSMILKKTNDIPFEFNLRNKQISLYHSKTEQDETDYEVVEDVSPERMMQEGIIRGKDYENYIELYRKVTEGKQADPVILEMKIHGKWDWNRIHAFSVDGDYVIGVLEDYNEIIYQDQKLREIREKVKVDTLTKLYSREYFVKEVEMALRQRGKGLQALFILDLDYFKQVNDTLGHIYGDQVLQETGILLKSIIRKTDLAGRLGGDEFVLFLQNVPDMEAMGKCAKKINTALIRTYGEGEQAVTVSVSIGIAVVEEEKTFQELYQRADQELYRVKAAERNGYSIAGADSAR